MRWEILRRAHNKRLLLFFNGWGMDAHVVEHLAIAPDSDALAVYDYRRVSIGLNVAALCDSYDDVTVIGWSMGVWAYAQVCAALAGVVKRVIAINGTAQPIHTEFGIDPGVYQATLDQFSAETREKFFRRMCGSSSVFAQFQARLPQRPLPDQRRELRAIQQTASTCSDESPRVDLALIGKQDRIIPAANQARYWQGRAGHMMMIDAPHYPFFLWKNWNDLLSY